MNQSPKFLFKNYYSFLGLPLLLGTLATGTELTFNPRIEPIKTRPQQLSLRPSGRVETFIVHSLGRPLPERSPQDKLPGQHFPEQGKQHLAANQKAQYNSNPPTSGPHYPQAAEWGIYTIPPLDEMLIQNLENGGVIISYRPDRVRGARLQQLRSQVRQLSQVNPRIILTPRFNLESAIALTAWTYLQNLNHYDPVAIQAFYAAHIAQGPECTYGLCPP